MTAELKTRFLGICPVCQGEFKLTQGGGSSEPMRLVHHGYQRPGYGYIVGDCFGVGYMAYQRSAQGCVEYKDAVMDQLTRARKTLADIDSGEAKEAWVKRRSNGKVELVKVLSDDPKFNEALRTFRTMVEYEIRDCTREVERMVKLITAWELKPVRTFEELAREKDLQKEARKAEREAKRAVAQAKAAELAAKRRRFEEERAALILRYREIFETLAESVESSRDVTQSARIHWVDMYKARSKKGYLHFYDRSLECDEALIKIGLAVRVTRHGAEYTRYADSSAFLMRD